jgi:chromosome partitioning protein
MKAGQPDSEQAARTASTRDGKLAGKSAIALESQPASRPGRQRERMRVGEEESGQAANTASMSTLAPRRAARRPRLTSARVLTIAASKGGVGKSTGAGALGVWLARHGRRVLLVDADPQANLTYQLGVRRAEQTIVDGLLAGLHDAYPNPPRTADAVITTAYPNLSMLPAPPAGQSNVSANELAGAERWITAADPRRGVHRLERALSRLDGEYDTIVIDSPPALGLLAINALQAADSVLLALRPEDFALAGLAATLELVDEVRETQPAIRVAGAIMIADPRQIATRTALARLEAADVELLDPIIPFSSAIAAAAIASRTPLPVHRRSSRVSLAYEKIADTLIQRGLA